MPSVGDAEILIQKDRRLVALDGEIRVLQPPLLYRSRPGALRVFGPLVNKGYIGEL